MLDHMRYCVRRDGGGREGEGVKGGISGEEVVEEGWRRERGGGSEGRDGGRGAG